VSAAGSTGSGGTAVPPPVPDKVLTPAFSLLIAAGLAYFIGLGMTTPVLPRYVEGPLGGGGIAVGIAVGAFAFGAVGCRPVAGRLGDRFDARVVVLIGSVLACVSVAGYALAGSLAPLVVFRIGNGAADAFFFVGAATLMTSMAGVSRAGEAASYFGIAVYTGFSIGPAIGEITHDALGYDGTWLVAAAISGTSFLLAWRLVDPRPPRAPTATKPPLLHKAGVMPGLVLALGTIGLAGYQAFVPLYVSSVGLSGARYVLLVYGLTALVLRLAGARLPDRLGALRMASVALLCSITGLLTIAAFPSKLGLFVGTIIFAGSGAYLFPATLSLAASRAPVAERGAVLGTFTAFFDISQGLGALALGGVVALSSYRLAFASGALASIAAIILAQLMLRASLGRRHAEAVAVEPGAAAGADLDLDISP
jgi:predicted MFS family arabinose efflux permease